MQLAKRLLPAMVQRGAGRMLFTSSIAAKMPGPYYATYAASLKNKAQAATSRLMPAPAKVAVHAKMTEPEAE